MAKVIASSLRKGNVVDIDNKLYVVLVANNIHPGKGTPVTQLDLRRIADGVKISERYRTTEQVERAFVEEKTYTFLIRDRCFRGDLRGMGRLCLGWRLRWLQAG